MPFDPRSLAPLIGGLGGATGGGNGFLRGWQRAEQAAEQRRLQEEQLGLQREDRDLRRQQIAGADARAQSAETRAASADTRAEQDQAIQIAQTFRDLLGDESIDDPAAFDQRLTFAQQFAPQLGVDTGFLESLRPAPTVYQRRKASKLLKDIETDPQIKRLVNAGEDIGSIVYERSDLGPNPDRQDGKPLWSIGEIHRLAQKPVPAQPLPKVTPTSQQPNTPEEQFYQTYASERGKRTFGELSTAQQAAARKDWMQADDRPTTGSDPEVAQLRKDLLRLQVDRAGDEKEPNQAQFTAATYAGRMEQAERTFGDVQNDIVTMRLPSFELQTNSWFARPTFQTPPVQSYMQAARNFINAVLRRESGAVISPSEFAEARQQYLPQPGETPEALAQKADNRRYVFDTMKRASGSAYQAPPPAVYPPLTKDATVGRVYLHNGKIVKVREKTRTGFLFDEVP